MRKKSEEMVKDFFNRLKFALSIYRIVSQLSGIGIDFTK